MFKVSSSGSNAGMEMSAPLLSGIVNNALFHFSPLINQTLERIGTDPSLSISDMLNGGHMPTFLAECQLLYRSHVFFSV